MLIIKMWGGLGNQMFQYAFGLYMAEKKGETPQFFFDINHSNQNDLPIKEFNINILSISTVELQKLGYNFSNVFLYRIKRKLIQTFPFVNNKIFVENGIGYLSKINNNYIVFDGYWQAYKYIEPIEQKLRKCFTFKKTFITDNSVLNEICTGMSVSIHIRKGDYLTGKNANIFACCSMEYYKSAINHLLDKLISPVFYIFSNDLEWAKKNLDIQEGIKLKFVNNLNCDNPSIADLFLMSCCKHQIIANSTFSWWAAWLNQNKKKVIIAPKNWYIGKRNDSTIELIPETWIRM